MQMEPTESLERDQLHDAVRLYNRCSQVQCFNKALRIVKKCVSEFPHSRSEGRRLGPHLQVASEKSDTSTI